MSQMAEHKRDLGTAEVYSLTFPRLRSPLPSFTLAFFMSPPFRCWLLSAQIRQHHELFSSTVEASSDVDTVDSETLERSTTETSSQSTEATQVMSFDEVVAWHEELDRREQHNRLTKWFQALSLNDLIDSGFTVTDTKVLEVISNLVLTSDNLPSNMTPWVSLTSFQNRNLLITCASESRSQPCFGVLQCRPPQAPTGLGNVGSVASSVRIRSYI